MKPSARSFLLTVAVLSAVSCRDFACGGCHRGPPPPPPQGDAGQSEAEAKPQEKQVAQLSQLTGKVTLERKSEPRKAKVGPLYLKDAVETGEESSVQVTFLSGPVIEVGSNARFSITEDENGMLLTVERGVFLTRIPEWTSAAAKEAGSLTIKTPFGITRLGNGKGELTLSVTADDAKVDVKVGTVELISREGQRNTLAAGGSLSFGTIQRMMVLRPMFVSVSPRTGSRVELKAQGARSWSALKKEMGLNEGDELRVRSGSSSLSVAGGDTALTLENGADVTWGGTQAGSTSESTRIALNQGAVQVAFGKSKKSALQVGDAALTADAGGGFTVQKDGKVLIIESSTGDATVQSGDTTQPLAAGQRARVVNGQVTVENAAPVPVSVASKSGVTIFHPGVSDVALNWPGEKGNYRVDVSSDKDFKELVVSGVVHKNSVKVPAPKRGALYWRVFPTQGDEIVAQGNAHFAPEPTRQELERNRNDVPEGSDTTTIYFQDKPPAVTFTYKADPKAAQYRISVFNADQLDRPVSERVVKTDRAPLEAGTLTEGKYLWSVTPLSATGDPLRGGKMSKLDIVYDNSVPQLVVLSPKNGDRSSSSVHVNGVAPVGGKLYVNDRPVELDEKHRFDAQVAPVGRPPMVVFRLTRKAAADAITVRMLKSR